MSALDIQIGGSHYKSKDIQPIEFLWKHGDTMDVCQKNMFKYVSRYPDKNGIKDLRKVVHYNELRRELFIQPPRFDFEEYFMQFSEADAGVLRLIFAGRTSEAAELVQGWLRDSQ